MLSCIFLIDITVQNDEKAQTLDCSKYLLSENPAKFPSLSNRAAEKSRQTIKGQRNVRDNAHQLNT